MEYLQKLQLERYEFFKSQNPETGRFNVIFEIEGKFLHAHQSIITLVSDTFNAMFSERWTAKDEPVKIKGNKFEDFEQFIHFCYSGACELNAENIITMIDLAEFYNVDLFKKNCEEYALKMEFNLENVFQFLEIAIRYFMDILKETLFKFVVSNFAQFSDAEEFLSLDYAIMNEIVAAVKNDVQPETLFKAVFRWSEQQAIKKREESIDESFNLNEAIKLQISPFLPLFSFESMNMKFLHDFVTKKRFIFSYDQFSEIFQKFYEPFKIKVTNSLNESIIGQIPHYDDAVEVIKSLNSDSGHSDAMGNFFKFKTMLNAAPSKPSKIGKTNKDCWYLFYYPSGNIGLRHSLKLPANHYIICEMLPEKNFSIIGNCKIEIYR